MLQLNFLHNWKEWLISHKKNVLLLIGILIFGTLTFESGFLRGKISQSEPLVISIPAVIETSVAGDTASSDQANPVEGMELIASQAGGKPDTVNCPLVGSRNSNKYHASTCAVVKRIKQENRVCFSSREDAEKRGYVAGCTK